MSEPQRFTYHGEDGHLFASSASDTWVCAVCGDEVCDHDERPVAHPRTCRCARCQSEQRDDHNMAGWA